MPLVSRNEPSLDSRWSWWVATVGVVIGALSFGAVTSVPILLKPLSLHWNTGASTVALVHTSAMFGAALGGLALERMLAAVGFFRIALFAALATSLGLLTAASAESLTTMHVVYGLLIGGIGQGAFFSPLTAAVSQWFDRHRSVAIAVVACGQSVGGLVLPPLMRWGVDIMGWQAMLSWYGLVAGAALMACAFVFRQSAPVPAHRHPDPSTSGATESVSARVLIMLGAGMALSNHASFIVIGHIIAFGEERGFTPTAAAALLSTILGISLVSRLSVGQLSAKWGSYKVLAGMSTLLAFATAGLALGHGPVALAAAAVAIGVAFGGYLPGYAILMRDIFPAEQAGRRIAEIYFFAFVAAGVGSWTGGWTRDITGGYAIPFWLAAASAVAGAAILLSCRRRLQESPR